MIYNLSLNLFTFHGISSHSTSNAKLLFLFFIKVNSAKLKMFLRLLCWNVLILLFCLSSKKFRVTFSENKNIFGVILCEPEYEYEFIRKSSIPSCAIMRYHALSCAAGGTRSLDAKWFFIDREFPKTSSPKMRIELNPFMAEVVII